VHSYQSRLCCQYVEMPILSTYRVRMKGSKSSSTQTQGIGGWWVVMLPVSV
jgi:hypothetical protein